MLICPQESTDTDKGAPKEPVLGSDPREQSPSPSSEPPISCHRFHNESSKFKRHKGPRGLPPANRHSIRATDLRQEAHSQLGGGQKSHSSSGSPSTFLILGFLDSKRKESPLECLKFPSDVITTVPSGTTSEDQKPKDITLTRRTP